MPPAQPPTEDPPPEAPATGNPNDKRALRSPLLDHKISDFKNFLIFIDSLKFLHFQHFLIGVEDIGLDSLIKHSKQFDSMGPVRHLVQKYFPHFLVCHIHIDRQQLNCQQQ